MSDLFTEEEPPHISKVEFSPFATSDRKKLNSLLTKNQLEKWKELQVKIEAVFGSATLSLQELASLEEDDLLPLDEHSETGVEIYANGQKVGLGEIVAVGNRFGVRLTSLEKNV